MTLYDEYRREFPIAAEPSEFRDIIEAEVKRALEWMRWRDKPMPAEAIKPGRYIMTAEVIVGNCCHAGIGCGIKCRGLVYGFPKASVNRCLENLANSGATFQAVGEANGGKK